MGFVGLSKLLPQEAVTIPNLHEGKTGDDSNVPQALRDVLVIRGRDLDSLPARVQNLVQLSSAEKKFFAENGYLVLCDVVSASLLEKGVEKVNRAYDNGKYHERLKKKYEGSSRGILSFGKHVCSSPSLTNIFAMSGLVTAAESLLGNEQVVLKAGKADVIYVPPSDIYLREEKDLNSCALNMSWNLGLGDKSKHIPDVDHFLTVCAILSNKNEFSTLMVWPGMFIALIGTITLNRLAVSFIS